MRVVESVYELEWGGGGGMDSPGKSGEGGGGRRKCFRRCVGSSGSFSWLLSHNFAFTYFR